MIVVKPIAITTNNLIASNVPLSEHPEWVSGTNYALGAMVSYQSPTDPYPRDYRLFLDGETHTISPDMQPNHWLDLGASLRYRTFDGIVGNMTSNPDSITFTAQPSGNFNAAFFFNVEAASVRVTIDDPIDGIVYDQTRDLTDFSNIVDYFTYQFEPVGETMREIYFLDLPNVPTANLSVEVSAPGGIASLGEFVTGNQNTIGFANFGTEVGIIDYSRKEVDQFGNFNVVQRSFAKFARYDITLETVGLARVQRFLASIRATPCVFVGDERREETVTYGFYKNFRTVIGAPSISSCMLEVEGLT